MAAEWHYQKDGKKTGPISATELKSLASSGELLSEDLIWKEGMAEWKPAKSAKGLFDSAESHEASTVAKAITSQADSAVAKGRSFVENAKGAAKKAAQYASKQAERTKLTTLTLPPVYQALGRHAFSSPVYRAEFLELFQQLDQVQEEQSDIKERTPLETKSFGDKAKAMAGKAMDAAQTQKLLLRQSSLFGSLGKAVYDKHESESGPQEFEKPIADALARLAMLDSELDTLSASKDGSWITPKRTAIAIGATMSGLLLIFMLMWKGGSSHSPPVLDFSKGPNGEEVAKIEEPKRIFFVFKDKEKGKVRHGLFTEFYDKERTKKRLEGNCYAEEWHGTVTESYESGEKRTERFYDRGKCVGTHQGFDRDGKIVWSLSFDGEGTALLAKSSTRAALSQIRFIADWNSLPPEQKVDVSVFWHQIGDVSKNPPPHGQRFAQFFVANGGGVDRKFSLIASHLGQPVQMYDTKLDGGGPFKIIVFQCSDGCVRISVLNRDWVRRNGAMPFLQLNDEIQLNRHIVVSSDKEL